MGMLAGDMTAGNTDSEPQFHECCAMKQSHFHVISYRQETLDSIIVMFELHQKFMEIRFRPIHAKIRSSLLPPGLPRQKHSLSALTEHGSAPLASAAPVTEHCWSRRAQDESVAALIADSESRSTLLP